MPPLWFKRSCTLGQDPKVQAVALTHGPGGVLVLEELLAICKLADDGEGTVATAVNVVAARAFVKPALARKILDALHTQGLIDYVEAPGSDGSFVAVLSGWHEWNKVDSSNAERQRRHRDKKRDSNALRNAAGRDGNATEVEVEEETTTHSSAATQPLGGPENVVRLEGVR